MKLKKLLPLLLIASFVLLSCELGSFPPSNSVPINVNVSINGTIAGVEEAQLAEPSWGILMVEFTITYPLENDSLSRFFSGKKRVVIDTSGAFSAHFNLSNKIEELYLKNMDLSKARIKFDRLSLLLRKQVNLKRTALVYENQQGVTSDAVNLTLSAGDNDNTFDLARAVRPTFELNPLDEELAQILEVASTAAGGAVRNKMLYEFGEHYINELTPRQVRTLVRDMSGCEASDMFLILYTEARGASLSDADYTYLAKSTCSSSTKDAILSVKHILGGKKYEKED